MNTSTKSNLKAQTLWFTDERLYVRLDDGREIGVPLDWFPKLLKATADQRKNWRLVGKGIGIHWTDIDEDISVKKLFE